MANLYSTQELWTRKKGVWPGKWKWPLPKGHDFRTGTVCLPTHLRQEICSLEEIWSDRLRSANSFTNVLLVKAPEMQVFPAYRSKITSSSHDVLSYWKKPTQNSTQLIRRQQSETKCATKLASWTKIQHDKSPQNKQSWCANKDGLQIWTTRKYDPQFTCSNPGDVTLKTKRRSLDAKTAVTRRQLLRLVRVRHTFLCAFFAFMSQQSGRRSCKSPFDAILLKAWEQRDTSVMRGTGRKSEFTGM